MCSFKEQERTFCSFKFYLGGGGTSTHTHTHAMLGCGRRCGGKDHLKESGFFFYSVGHGVGTPVIGLGRGLLSRAVLLLSCVFHTLFSTAVGAMSCFLWSPKVEMQLFIVPSPNIAVVYLQCPAL